MRINELEADQPYRGYLFIRDAAVRTGKNGSQFIKLTLSDQDYNEIIGFLWNVQPEDIDNYVQGKVVGIYGRGKQFNDTLQLDIQRIRLTNDGDNININDFIQTAPEEAQAMIDEIITTIDEMKNPEIKAVTQEAFLNRLDSLDYFPAAKSVHHAFQGGLLYHTLSMLRLAKAIQALYPTLDPDLLYAGVILHDLGKVDEMDADRNGTVSDYTDKGKLLGHIPVQIAEIDKIAENLDISEEVTNLLEHMILSHHYEPEYGSPVKPMFPEAEMLHHIDMIDARMNSMNKIQKNLQPGTFSERIPVLDGIRIYRPTFDSKPE